MNSNLATAQDAPSQGISKPLTSNRSSSDFVTWKAVAPIYADVLISPWNLLVGGLLISKLTLVTAFSAVVLGYAILGLVFSWYGGLGFQLRRDTSMLLQPVFGLRGNKSFFSPLLALGQIGWFAVICDIAAPSFSTLVHLPVELGLVTFGVVVTLMAAMKLNQLGVVKFLVSASSLALMAYLLWAILSQEISITFLSTNTSSLLWGVSVVLTSLLSLASVSPDFYSQLRSSSDVHRTTLFGVMVPGIVTVTIGIFLFAGRTEQSLATVLGILPFAVFSHLFNVITSTDASTAIYSPMRRFQYMFDIPKSAALLMALVIGITLALSGLSSSLEGWLSIIAAIFPGIMGVTVARYSLSAFGFRQKRSRTQVEWRAIFPVVVSALLILVLNVTLLSWSVAVLAFTLYVLMMGVTINLTINIGGDRTIHRFPSKEKD